MSRKSTIPTNNWGGHSRISFPIHKSVPLMEADHKILREYNGEPYSIHVGFNSVQRKLFKKMHKKKRRQFFKKEILCMD